MVDLAVRHWDWCKGTITYTDFEATGQWYIEDDALYTEFEFDRKSFFFKFLGSYYASKCFLHEHNFLEIYTDEKLIGVQTSVGIMSGRWYQDTEDKKFSIHQKSEKYHTWHSEKEFGIINNCS